MKTSNWVFMFVSAAILVPFLNFAVFHDPAARLPWLFLCYFAGFGTVHCITSLLNRGGNPS